VARVTKAAEHLSLEEVKQRVKSDPRPLYRQRWLIIYNALVDPIPLYRDTSPMMKISVFRAPVPGICADF
jgi:hypothetical protein